MFLGLDIGTSSIKAALLDAQTGQKLATATSPSVELPIDADRPGFAEQDPRAWWEHTVKAVQMLPSDLRAQVVGIGIGYQMHGLVLVDENAEPTRKSIIWCDSRASEIGERAFRELGGYCLTHLLNSPGNFTAAKLRWVIDHERDTVQRSRWAMLPGDYIALKLTRQPLTSNSGLSEMALWDFLDNGVSRALLDHFEIDPALLPPHVPTCGPQGQLIPEVASLLGLPTSAQVSFRAGDQPTNALALGAIGPGEVAATAGTSGVIYSVTGDAYADPAQRVNTFLHVSREDIPARYGVLCCINGCGSLVSWLRNKVFARELTYDEMNASAATAPVGSDGLLVFPFGNGAERILGNTNVGASIKNLEFTRHDSATVFRAAQESVAFALHYGVEDLPKPEVIRASNANLFLSPVFAQTVADLSGAAVEIHDTQGVFGAAWGAAMGLGFVDRPRLAGVARRYEPKPSNLEAIRSAFDQWRDHLQTLL